MARIFPFQALRYSPQAGPLEHLLTQPYDKISPAMQAQYLQLSTYNLVRIILGQRFPSDTETDSVYTRAGSLFRQWIASGILTREAKPALYPYSQTFEIPGTTETLVRRGFIGLGEVVDYAERIVHRHEHTLSGPKKDRLQVLQHTGAHFGQIFMLYPDKEQVVDGLIGAELEASPVCEVTDEYKTIHRLGRIDDPARIASIQQAMADRKLLIADGHHRYETALNFRAQNPDLPGARGVMMTFVNMYSPGLRILPTHRLIQGLENLSAEALIVALKDRFAVREVAGLDALTTLWRQPDPGRIRIGLVLAGRPQPLLLERDRKRLELDVTVLHDEILQQVLGISPEAVREEKHLRYIRGATAAAEEVQAGRGQAAFLLEPASVDDVAEISFGGGVMPQKSTDFYPKLLTGMAIYRLEDGFPQ